MKSLEEIQATLIAHKQQLWAKYPIRSLAIFGSCARDEHTEKSDIDIIVGFNGNIGIRFIDLADEIESIIGSKVDLVAKNGIKERYLSAINPDLKYV